MILTPQSWAPESWAALGLSPQSWGGDDLVHLNDDFSSGSTMTGNGWLIEDTAPSSSPSDLITAGRADLTIAAGGVGGSFWFDANDGALWYREITGPFDCRIRAQIRNAANTGLPLLTQFRIAGLAAHSPNRTTMEYVHSAIGTDNTANYREEWKSTDNSDSAYAYQNATLTGGQLLYDLRIIRHLENPQQFSLLFRAGTSDPLESDENWSPWPATVVDREDVNTPDRVANNGSAAVALPATLRVGPMVYASAATHDIRMFLDGFQAKRPLPQ